MRQTQSYQSPVNTPPDFWNKEPSISGLIQALDDSEQDKLAEMLEELTTAWRFGDCAEEGEALAKQISEWQTRKAL